MSSEPLRPKAKIDLLDDWDDEESFDVPSRQPISKTLDVGINLQPQKSSTAGIDDWDDEDEEITLSPKSQMKNGLLKQCRKKNLTDYHSALC